MTKIAFLGNSHSNMGRLAEKYNSLLDASELGTCCIIDCQGKHETIANNILFASDLAPIDSTVAIKNKLLFQNKLNETYLDFAHEKDEIGRVMSELYDYKDCEGSVIIYNVFKKDTVAYLKDQGFRLVHVLHNNPDSDRLQFLLPRGMTGIEELTTLATPLLTDFEHGSTCDTTITLDFNNTASMMKELHRLFL
jgi:hypothetical protein